MLGTRSCNSMLGVDPTDHTPNRSMFIWPLLALAVPKSVRGCLGNLLGAPWLAGVATCGMAAVCSIAAGLQQPLESPAHGNAAADGASSMYGRAIAPEVQPLVESPQPSGRHSFPQHSTAPMGASAGGWLKSRPTSCRPAHPQLGEGRYLEALRCRSRAPGAGPGRARTCASASVSGRIPRRPSPLARPTELPRGCQFCVQAALGNAAPQSRRPPHKCAERLAHAGGTLRRAGGPVMPQPPPPVRWRQHGGVRLTAVPAARGHAPSEGRKPARERGHTPGGGLWRCAPPPPA